MLDSYPGSILATSRPIKHTLDYLWFEIQEILGVANGQTSVSLGLGTWNSRFVPRRVSVHFDIEKYNLMFKLITLYYCGFPFLLYFLRCCKKNLPIPWQEKYQIYRTITASITYTATTENDKRIICSQVIKQTYFLHIITYWYIIVFFKWYSLSWYRKD